MSERIEGNPFGGERITERIETDLGVRLRNYLGNIIGFRLADRIEFLRNSGTIDGVRAVERVEKLLDAAEELDEEFDRAIGDLDDRYCEIAFRRIDDE